MRAKWIGIGVLVTLVLVVLVTTVGWFAWRWMPFGYGMPGGMMGGGRNTTSCPNNVQQPYGSYGGRMGWGMRDNGYATDACLMQDNTGFAVADNIDMEAARQEAQSYVDRYNGHFLISEVMEFERNFYAIAIEEDTGMGAMELLIDKTTGAVGPEMGPNMMWNSEYGMHGRGMMGTYSGDPVYDEQDMLAIAQSWLDERKPGIVTEEHGDMFYGYMTAHTMKDGEMDGMLSVNAATGDVWYHTWHGDFIAMQSYEENGE